jgi:hypothetical protein
MTPKRMGSQCLGLLIIFWKVWGLLRSSQTISKGPGTPFQEVESLGASSEIYNLPGQNKTRKPSNVEAFQVVDLLGFCADRAHPWHVYA